MMRMTTRKENTQATRAAGFKDRRSYIDLSKPPRTWLFGRDMTDLREKVFERDGYKCVDCGQPVTWDTGEMSHQPRRPLVGDGLSVCFTRDRACHRNLDNHGEDGHF